VTSLAVKAVIQFRQDATFFGAEATFCVEFASGEQYAIKGGQLGRIRLADVGVIRLRATLDGYSSSWFSLSIYEGEIVDLQITPPGHAARRAFGLLARADNYLSIQEVARTMVPEP
jgi:hypothetical protein